MDELSGNLGIPQFSVLNRNASRVCSFHKTENKETSSSQTLQNPIGNIWCNNALPASFSFACSCHVPGFPKDIDDKCHNYSCRVLVVSLFGSS